jgi:hypothetical protein
VKRPGLAHARPRGEGREHARALVSKLRESHYASPDWLLVDEVRGMGVEHDVLRQADAIGVCMSGPKHRLSLHGFEVKTSRADFLREIKRPEKSGPLKLFCDAWYLVVPCPWKRIVLSTDLELPAGWGLWEVGTGDPVHVAEAVHREAEAPTPAFIRGLFRATMREGAVGADVAGGAPLVPIARKLSRSHLALLCGHPAPAPLAKPNAWPRALPCEGCAQDLPTDLEVVLGAIGDAGPEALDAIEAALRQRRAA